MLLLKAIRLLLFLFAAIITSQVHADPFPPAPGIRYDIGGYSIHMLCRGQGQPTVIIDAGLGVDSSDWFEIQNRSSVETRVCVFDRPGYGWSDTGPQPRHSLQIARELETLLQKAHIQGPYVLVGHSFGGYNVRIFAARNPNKVAGMVLVDASHENQYEKLDIKLPRYYQRTGNILILPKHVNADSSFSKPSVLLEKAIHAARAEISSLYDSAMLVRQYETIPKVPLIVISRGRAGWTDRKDAVSREKIWMTLQYDLWKLSPISQQIFAKQSGHNIHLDQPDLVVSAINDVVIMSRVMCTTPQTGYTVSLLQSTVNDHSVCGQ